MSEDQLTSGGGSDSKRHFEPFDLTVHLGPDATPWVSAVSPAGAVYGIPRHAHVPPLPDLLDLVYDYTDTVQVAEPQPDPELAQVLGDLVFGDPMVLQLFQATRGVAADRGRQLLFRILASSPHLAVLPWELLPDPAAARGGDGYRYLALAPDTHLVRLARGRVYPASTALLKAPLNLLIVLSSPTPQNESEDWLAFDTYEVKRALLAELSPLEEAGMLRIDVEDRPTLENLRRCIGRRRRGYHLFHYVGHALPDRLILEDSSRWRRDVTSSQLIEVLRECPDLRLAVFAGCETARAAGDPESLDPRTAEGSRELFSLTDYCVQQVCPAVIGMQAVLPLSTERVLTRFFYQALANGYSTAEALRLARGAIRGDERFGGDLLDWSVPALFVGSTEPGPLVPRSPAAPRPKVRRRFELKLGFLQSEERFFARERPLREAVDVLSGLTPERVLVITGAAGVGKTALVDRALEELGTVIRPEDLREAVTLVLYVHFDRLVPQVAQALESLKDGTMPDLVELADLEADYALEQLCRFANELLRQGGETARARVKGWTAMEWWERIVGELVQHRFVLVIDQVCLLDRLQRGLLKELIGGWLKERSNADLETKPKEDLLEDLQKTLSALQETREQCTDLRPSMQKHWAQVREKLPQELMKHLDSLPDRLLLESGEVYEHLLEDQVKELSYEVALGAAVSGAGSVEPQPDDAGSEDLLDALKQIEEVRTSLANGLRVLAGRLSPRMAITAGDRPWHFLDLPEGQVFEMHLAHLTWPETWLWIRRNLPVLAGFGVGNMSPLWPRLGARLADWEELERRVVQDRSADLRALAKKIAPRRPAQPSATGALTMRRGQRALRIAAAGPVFAGCDAMADAISRLAIEHGIGGQVVLNADEAGALATLIDEPSPFEETVPSLEDIVRWLERVLAKQPDIVLLDYGYKVDEKEALGPAGGSRERTLLGSIRYVSLLIAAGGHHDMIAAPGVYPEVLSVGPLDNEGTLRPYAAWHDKLEKPNLFMADDLSRTALATALKPDVLERFEQEQTWGSSFAALNAVATAALVWSILPDLSPRAIRKMLVDACEDIDGVKGARSLTVAGAVAAARRHAVKRALKAGPASFQTLGARTGIEARMLRATLESLIKKKKVDRLLTSGRVKRFQLK